ncbi:hypothetical protein BDV10DRAFT_130514 [Aspergillus recurvatus]
MLFSKRLFLADEELGKKDDDHRPKHHHDLRWQPKPWKHPRRRRILLIPTIIYLFYVFFKNMPTDIPPARDRLKSNLPPTQHVIFDARLPPGLTQPEPPRVESDTNIKDELYYKGKLQFYHLASTLKLFSGRWREEPFQRNSIRGCKLGERVRPVAPRVSHGLSEDKLCALCANGKGRCLH